MMLGPLSLVGLVGVVVVGSLVLATVATVIMAVVSLVALVLSAGVAALLIGGSGWGAWYVTRRTIPWLAGKQRRGRRERRGRRLVDEAQTPVDLLRRRYAAGEIGQTAFRQGLVDLLKERYVGGELTLGEFESRVRHLYQDPALRPPAA